MYRFDDANLIELLNKWDLTQGDWYWLMIKSCMYAMAGETVKGEQILREILPKIRQQLVKNNKDEYFMFNGRMYCFIVKLYSSG